MIEKELLEKLFNKTLVLDIANPVAIQRLCCFQNSIHCSNNCYDSKKKTYCKALPINLKELYFLSKGVI